jgi:hypothetical protein
MDDKIKSCTKYDLKKYGEKWSGYIRNCVVPHFFHIFSVNKNEYRNPGTKRKQVLSETRDEARNKYRWGHIYILSTTLGQPP